MISNIPRFYLGTLSPLENYWYMVLRKEISFDKSIPYHIITRAVEGRKIFVNGEDCLRCIFQIYVANIGRPAPHLHQKDLIKAALALLKGEDIPEKLIVVEHPPLVYILSFNEVINHNHFILVPRVDWGISKYMQNWKTGFAMYYNLKHSRQGNLFEKPYKIIPIQTNFQLDAVLNYVNVKNTLDVLQPSWREKGLKDWKGVFDSLGNYQFSSFPDLFGQRNSKILAPRQIIEKFFGKEITTNKEDFLKFIRSYLQNQFRQYYPFFLEEV